MKILTAAVCFGLAGIPITGACAQDAAPKPGHAASTASAVDADWKPLRDEPSRADLFQLIVAAAKTETDRSPQPFAFKGRFVFPHDAIFDDIENKDRKNSIFGIDISHYTKPTLKFDLLKQQNVRFVYVKATQGTQYKDTRFEFHWKALESLPADQKILRGAYHFLSSSPNEDGASQADRFIAFVNLHGGFKKGDMPPVVDLEWDKKNKNAPDRWRNRKPDEIVDTTLKWLNRVQEKTGRTPMLYTARSWWRERGITESDFAKFSNFRIWIADYSRSARAVEIPAVPNKAKFDLWQFSESSKLSQGYGGGLDANVFNGTEEQFLADFR